MTPTAHLVKSIRVYYENRIALLEKALSTEEAEWIDMFTTCLEMRRALKSLCDESQHCTCTACRAAWAWDHKHGVLSQFLHDNMEDFEEPTSWSRGHTQDGAFPSSMEESTF